MDWDNWAARIVGRCRPFDSSGDWDHTRKHLRTASSSHLHGEDIGLLAGFATSPICGYRTQRLRVTIPRSAVVILSGFLNQAAVAPLLATRTAGLRSFWTCRVCLRVISFRPVLTPLCVFVSPYGRFHYDWWWCDQNRFWRRLWRLLR